MSDYTGGRIIHDCQSLIWPQMPACAGFCGALGRNRKPGGQPVLVHFTISPIMSLYQILHANKMSDYRQAMVGK